MITGDAAYIKKINRTLIIGLIIAEGPISRADLSKATDLTRATVSAQVADLLADDLLVETNPEQHPVGRRPIMLSINPQAGYALGIDLDYTQISFTLTDLLGSPVCTNVIDIHTVNYNEILSILIEQIKKYQSKCNGNRYGMIGIVIGIHGLVANDEMIHYVPRFNWTDVNLKADLKKQIDTIPIYVENIAHLCALAERVYVHHQTDNLLYVTLHSGIHLGLMMKNEFFRGHDGYAGEVGHMIVEPGGKPCSCGNKGCLEKYASESSFYQELAKERKMESVTYEQIQKWLDEGNEDLQNKMEQFIYYLSISLNNLIQLYNPDMLVLDSELLRIYPGSIHKIKANLSSPIAHNCHATLSTIGKKAGCLGACALAIKYFFDVPILNITNTAASVQNEKVFI